MQEEDGIVEFDNPDDSCFSFYPQGTGESGSIYLREKESERWHTIRLLSLQNDNVMVLQSENVTPL